VGYWYCLSYIRLDFTLPVILGNIWYKNIHDVNVKDLLRNSFQHLTLMQKKKDFY